MLKQSILNAQNFTRTENNALTNVSTKSAVLDLFALGGAVQKSSNIDLELLIRDALFENERLALKVIFYLSDIREGQGRRDFFRLALLEVINYNIKVAEQLLSYIPEFGRWDYLYWFINTPLERAAFKVFAAEVERAVDNKEASLVFKWLASEDASSKETIHNAKLTRKYFGLTAREYRKLLSWGRKELGNAVVERKMSANEWLSIDYSRVPSVAMKNYRKAFERHNPDHFESFISDVKSGKTKINSSVLYPSDIARADDQSHGLSRDALVEQWKALPNYLSENVRALAVVDTSGSMTWGSNPIPIDVATALGVYLGERIVGEFNNTVISFSAQAKLIELQGKDALQKIQYLKRKSINENTNLQSVFALLLDTARQHSVPASEMPNRIIIISDMEFDRATSGWNWRDGQHNNTTNLEAIKQKYELSGYEFPQIIFWNVEARNQQVAATVNESGVILVSGYSPVIMKSVLSDEPYITPYKAMLHTVDVPRYSFIDKL